SYMLIVDAPEWMGQTKTVTELFLRTEPCVDHLSLPR
ncbi:MAG: hypothetical protein RI904_2780, partial [Pseudomonadota bacterium]